MYVHTLKLLARYQWIWRLSREKVFHPLMSMPLTKIVHSNFLFGWRYSWEKVQLCSWQIKKDV